MSTRRSQVELPGDDDLEDGPRGPTPLQWIVLALRAAARRRVVALGVLLAGLATAGLYYAQKPRLYRVEARILAQRSSVVRSVYEDVPTRSAWDIIHRRENLMSLVRETKLETAARDSRVGSLLGIRTGRPRASGEAVLDALVTKLDRRLLVTADEGTIAIQLDWEDPKLAYALVQTALENFLEARHLQEVTAIDEVLSVLQGRAAKLRTELEGALEDARRRATHVARPAAERAQPPNEDLVRLQSLLEAKRRAVQDVEEFRRRRLADLQAQLDQARNTLSDAHPTVIGLRRDIDALSRESPQIEALREDERKMQSEYADRLAREGHRAPPAATAALGPPPADARSPRDEDPRVRDLRLQYEETASRINQAQLDLDAARAAFKYRYSVVWPPQLPKDPVSPNPEKVFGLGALASLIVAVLAAAAPDLWRGRIVERWQVEHDLGVTVLGEVSRR